jgi:hypothetical protein
MPSMPDPAEAGLSICWLTRNGHSAFMGNFISETVTVRLMLL